VFEQERLEKQEQAAFERMRLFADREWRLAEMRGRGGRFRVVGR
jgi:hypothetical protein